MIHVPDISKDFILNKAVRDATNILLKPYMPAMLSESCQTTNIFGRQYEMVHHITRSCILNSQDFLLKMARIAWDFLNVLNAFQNNSTSQVVGESDPLD